MVQVQIVPVILAGGSGERLWPLSKCDYPKQFVALDASGLSLFQQSVERVADRRQFAAPVIVCNDTHRFIVSEQLRAIGIADAVLIVEPVARNTAPALALAALHVQAQMADSVLLVLPSDHRIDQHTAFLDAVAHAAQAAADGWLTTFAITPHAQETGYGYIHIGETLAGHMQVHRIRRFVEKPDRATAAAYLREGGYGWNSGMFILQASLALAELEQFAPQMVACCRTAYAHHAQDYLFLRPQREAMEKCPSDSIDYALMEHTLRGAVMPVSLGWSDLGSWRALDDGSAKDATGNALHGHVIAQDSTDCYIRSDGTLIAALGVRDLVIVAADGALLVGHKDQTPQVKSLLSRIRAEGLPDTALRSFAHRPWGSFHNIDRGDRYQVKKLHVKPGGKISLQAHRGRSEHWVVVAGRATVTNGDTVCVLEANQSTYIPAGTVHRLENREEMDLVVIEVQTGSYLGEDDITRFEDLYHRADADGGHVA